MPYANGLDSACFEQSDLEALACRHPSFNLNGLGLPLDDIVAFLVKEFLNTYISYVLYLMRWCMVVFDRC